MNNISRCGIVTFHHSHNYGSVLQAYALSAAVSKLGLRVEIIDFRHPVTVDKYEWKLWSLKKSFKENITELLLRGLLQFGKGREKAFKHFIDICLPLSERVDDRNQISDDQYDYLICGSDQIWNPESSGQNNPIYFLDFGNNAVKFSYAASSGSRRFADGEIELYKGYLLQFRSIGVREEFMKDYIHEVLGMLSSVNPDPTFLLNIEEWTKLEKPYPNIPQKYVLVYTIQKSNTVVKYAQQVAHKLNLPLVYICNERGLKAFLEKDVDHKLMDVSPEQFLWLFHNAHFVVTNTFHGNMFSVIYRKNFVHYCTNKADSRILTLHNTIGLGNSRFVKTIKDFDSIPEIIDYKSIESKISEYAQTGYDYLKRNFSDILI